MSRYEADQGLHIIQHPLAEHHLAILRQQETSAAEFRTSIQRISLLLAIEATRQLSVSEVEIQTPLTTTNAKTLNQRIGLIPILRAGLGMVEPFLDLMPAAEVWHLGFYRDESTAKPIHYYSNLPAGRPVDVAFLLDPMLATGGSLIAGHEQLVRWGVKQIKLVSILAAPEGIDAVRTAIPDAEMYVGAVDQCLNEQKFIVPGLGDAGDRTFAT